MVVDVESGSPADVIGIKARDILVGIGRYHPSTLEELGQLLAYIEANELVTVSFLRVDRSKIIRYRKSLRAR